MEQIYGKEFDLRNKLKQEFLAIGISAKSSPSIEIKIYQKVHKLASRIKAAKAQNLLESDFEYISLVYQLLPENQKEKWVNLASSNPTWDSFYTFLGDVYEKALLKKQINDSCKQNSGQDKNICTNCKRSGHSADKCYGGKVLTTSISVDACPVCEGSLHQVEIKTSEGPKTITSKRLLSCSNFYSASDEDKKEIFLKVKNKTKELCDL